LKNVKQREIKTFRPTNVRQKRQQQYAAECMYLTCSSPREKTLKSWKHSTHLKTEE